MRIYAMAAAIVISSGCRTIQTNEPSDSRTATVESRSDQPDPATERTSPGKSAPSVYDDQSPLRFRLVAAFGEILRTKLDTEKVHSGMLHLEDGTKLPVEIKTKGNTSLADCVFPKLKIKITDKKRIAAPPFSGTAKFKLGVHCLHSDPATPNKRLGDPRAVYREQFAHRIYEILTPIAYRTRRAMIHYEFTDDPSKSETMPAFLLEKTSHLKKRIVDAMNDGKPFTDRGTIEDPFFLPGDNYEPNQLYLNILFERLIANKDWSLWGHGYGELSPWNQKEFILSSLETVTVPQDFDIAGTVIWEPTDAALREDLIRTFADKKVEEIDFPRELSRLRSSYGPQLAGTRVQSSLAKLQSVPSQPTDPEHTIPANMEQDAILDYLLLHDNLQNFFKSEKKGIGYLTEPMRTKHLQGYKNAIARFREVETTIFQELEGAGLDKEGYEVYKSRLKRFFNALPKEAP